MKPVVAVIAPGAMGSAVGRRLVENGVEVLTSLAGRSDASAARARDAGLKEVGDDDIATADVILSIVPPGEAVGLAQRLSPALTRSNRKPVYVDCNAVNPETADRIAAIVAATGAPFADGGIIGPPPQAGSRTILYVSGPEASRVAVLREHGLDIRVLAGPLSAASALKMSYAGITKGFTALGAAMMLAASRGGTTEALQQELRESQPALLAWLTRSVPGMYGKAYRWVAEMEEIAGFVGEDAAAGEMLRGSAALYERLAADNAGEQREIGTLIEFLTPKR